MQKLMAIFAHPDDEGAMGGTLAHYANQPDTEVMLVCTTRGEVGEISAPSLATPETLGEVRQRELENACAALGIQHLRFLDYRDSGMQGTPPNEDPRALIQANPDEARARMVGLIREFRPDVVVTFEPFGWYGHPDHITTGKWATEAYALAGQADVLPELGAPWQAQRLFQSVIPFSRFKAMVDTAVEAGIMENSGFLNAIPEEQQLATEAAVTHVIAVGDQYDRKQKATFSHATQFGEESLFRKIPEDMMRDMWASEHFIQVVPAVDGDGGISAELFPT